MSRGATYTDIGKAVLGHDIWIIKVSAVNNDQVAKGFIKSTEIEGGEFIPVCQNE